MTVNSVRVWDSSPRFRYNILIVDGHKLELCLHTRTAKQVHCVALRLLPSFLRSLSPFLVTQVHVKHKRRSSIRLSLDARRRAQNDFIASYKTCGVIKYACKVAGVSRQTYYTWLNDSQFRDEFALADDEIIDDVENVLLREALKGKHWAVTFFLKGRRKDVYADKSQISLSLEQLPPDSGDEIGPASIIDVVGALPALELTKEQHNE